MADAGLKPCPFCGGAVELERTTGSYEKMNGQREWWGVLCRNTINVGGTCAIQQVPSASKEAAVERWNCRATHPTEAGAPTAPASQPELTVWYGAMPESNGKSNFTAILKRKDAGPFDTCHITIDRSEYPDRVRYEADRVRWIIGELAEEPFILDYDADKHSGYKKPEAGRESAVPGAEQDAPAFDPVVEANRKLLLERSQVGLKKYGTTLAAAGLSRAQLAQHALEEALDLANYLQTIIQTEEAQHG